MCPVCLTTAMLISGSITASGGIAAVFIQKLARKNSDGNLPRQSSNQSKEDNHD